uniref:Uncharacterized protein n=1 Tax=Glossina brevipalpis TaxID=37001 RepID=A0A1A9WJI4_9MUSC
MLYLIQRGKVRSQVVNVPEGLPEILTDITREVLRCQPTPECICQFIIDYLHSVIVTREKARVAKGIIDRALMKVDEIIADLCICDIPKEKSEQMTLAMEECFKRFLAKRRCEKDRQSEVLKFKEIDVLDEIIRKCKFSEEELKKSRPTIEEAYTKFMDFYLHTNEDEEATEALYQHFRDRELQRQIEKEKNEAAVKIQAYFRGYAVRKSIRDIKKSSLSLPPSFDIHSLDDQKIIIHDIAARKIQQFFRNRFPKTYERKTKLEEICADASKTSILVPPVKKLQEKGDGTIMPISSSVLVEAQSEQEPTRPENIPLPEERKQFKAIDVNVTDFLEVPEVQEKQGKSPPPTDAVTEPTAMEEWVEEE